MQMLGEEDARAFGQLVRERRKALGLRQEDVVLATGVGRRYLIELEAGKPTARLGPALMIARHLGIHLGLAGRDAGPAHSQETPIPPALPDLPDLEN